MICMHMYISRKEKVKRSFTSRSCKLRVYMESSLCIKIIARTYPHPYDVTPPKSSLLIVLVNQTIVTHTPYPYDVIPPASSLFIVHVCTTRPDNDESYPHPYDVIPPTSLLLIVLVGQTMVTHTPLGRHTPFTSLLFLIRISTLRPDNE